MTTVDQSGRVAAAATTIFVARQPVFCRRMRKVGYELLYRGSADATQAAGVSTDAMAAEVITHALLDMQRDPLAEGGISFINVSRQLLLSGCLESFAPHEVVFEIPKNISPDEDVMRVCRHLHGLGYSLALDDFEFNSSRRPLLEVVEIVKIDVLDRPPAEIGAAIESLPARKPTLVAKRVETSDLLAACKDMGFDLFQGYHPGRPDTVSRRRISTEQLAIIRLMNLLYRDDASDSEVEEAFRSDVSLSYTLLQLVNSAAVGGRGIHSIRHAIHLVGRTALQRWLALLLVSAAARPDDAVREFMKAAYVRARFCERLAEVSGRRGDAGSQFMVGLFSLLDALFAMPLEDILARVELAPEISLAVLQRKGPYADTLVLAEAYERGRWGRVTEVLDRIGVPRDALAPVYRDAVDWAAERTRAMPASS